MPRKQSPLRAVKPDERPERVKPKSLTEAAKSGTVLEVLEFMRDRTALAVEDPNCPARELSSLTRRLHELIKDIAAIKAASSEEGNGPANTGDESFDASAI